MKLRLLTISLLLGVSSIFAQNVGISNDAAFTIPQSPLHIYWTSDGNLLQLSRSSAVNTGLTFSVNSNDYSILNRQNNALIFGTNNTERMRITNTGNVGIGTTTPAAQLHTTGTVRFSNYISGANGAILRTNTTGDLSITNFSGVANDVLLGTGAFGSMNTLAWQLSGNSGTNPSSNFIGTTDAVDFVIRTSNIERMRAKSSGEFIVGGTDPGMSGDLFSVISTSTLPWAINGYANNNGGALYAEIRTGNSTNFSIAEFEHFGSGTGYCIYASNNSTNTTANAGTGIYGESSTGHNGSDYYLNNYAGVYGVGAFNNDQYSFGVVGIMSGTGRRSGGVFGSYYTTDWGALGYRASNGTAYGLCYVGGQTTTAKSTTNVHYEIGMGGWGDLMGGHIKGEIYGLHVSGNRYSLYINGYQFINKTIVQLNEVENTNERIPTFISTSLNSDIIDKGTAEIIINKETKIDFNPDFVKLINKDKPIIITITPIGDNVNAYILSYNDKGFIVKCTENNTNTLNEHKNTIKINWIAIGTLNNEIHIPNEIISKDYDINMDKFLINEADTGKEPQPMWWDGQQLRFEAIPTSAYPKKYSSKEEYLQNLKIQQKQNINNKQQINFK